MTREHDGLETPLLPLDRTSPLDSMSAADWPAASVQRVHLLVPLAWKAPAAGSDSARCTLRYDAVRRLLLVVSVEDEGRVLDVIDPDDMIGVDLQVHLMNNSESERERLVRSSQEGNNSNNTNTRASNEPATNDLRDTQAAAVLSIYAYPRRDPAMATWFHWCGLTAYTPQPNPHYQRPDDSSSKLGPRYAHPRLFTLAPSEDLADCNALLSALRALAVGQPIDKQQQQRSSTKKYLIVVNPRSGPKRNSAAIAEQQVQPMLEQAGIEVEICVTTHPRHAQERMAELSRDGSSGPGDTDVAAYDGLVLLGGDGIIHEVLNGIMDRADAADILRRIKIGVVGCGTANGFATAVTFASNERYGLVEETFLICKGRTVTADLSRYTTTNRSYISFLTYSWAMIADIDIESERIHFLGEARFDVWAVWRVLFLRRYRARFSYLPASNATKSKYAMDIVAANMPALESPVPSDWVTVEDDFLLFWASHVTHAAMHTYHSPPSNLQDGSFQVLVVKGSGISRYRMARILLGLETGSHVGMPGAEFVECVAYRLEHLTSGSFNDIDGEHVEDGPIQAHVLPGAFQVFCNSKRTPKTGTTVS